MSLEKVGDSSLVVIVLIQHILFLICALMGAHQKAFACSKFCFDNVEHRSDTKGFFWGRLSRHKLEKGYVGSKRYQLNYTLCQEWPRFKPVANSLPALYITIGHVKKSSSHALHSISGPEPPSLDVYGGCLEA